MTSSSAVSSLSNLADLTWMFAASHFILFATRQLLLFISVSALPHKHHLSHLMQPQKSKPIRHTKSTPIAFPLKTCNDEFLLLRFCVEAKNEFNANDKHSRNHNHNDKVIIVNVFINFHIGHSNSTWSIECVMWHIWQVNVLCIFTETVSYDALCTAVVLRSSQTK